MVEDFGNLVVGEGFSFNGQDFRKMQSPGVYVFLLMGVPLYIGATRHGMVRPFNNRHEQAGIAQAECDEVKFWPCRSVSAAFRLERTLIDRCKPRGNRKQGKPRRELIESENKVTESVTCKENTPFPYEEYVSC